MIGVNVLLTYLSFGVFFTSPLTGEVLENKALIPQHLLRSLIREWRQGQGYLHVKP